MLPKLRNADPLAVVVNDQPPDLRHGPRKALVSGEVVYISVYTSVYKTVYRNLVKPAPNAEQFPDHGIAVDPKPAGDHPNLRVVR